MLLLLSRELLLRLKLLLLLRLCCELLLIWELLLGWENCLRLELLGLKLLGLRLTLEFLLKALLRLRSLYLVKRLKLGKTIKALDASKLCCWLLNHLGARESKDLALLLVNLTGGKLGAGGWA